MTKYLTFKGLEKIKKELHQLETVERRKIAERIKSAASFGDLKENSAYQEAKDDQGFLERKILELREIVYAAKVIKKEEQSEKVQIGSTVLVDSDGKKQEFQIVDSEEVNLLEGKISFHSPLGKALMDKFVGDIAEIEAPERKVKYKIIKIS